MYCIWENQPVRQINYRLCAVIVIRAHKKEESMSYSKTKRRIGFKKKIIRFFFSLTGRFPQVSALDRHRKVTLRE